MTQLSFLVFNTKDQYNIRCLLLYSNFRFSLFHTRDYVHILWEKNPFFPQAGSTSLFKARKNRILSPKKSIQQENLPADEYVLMWLLSINVGKEIAKWTRLDTNCIQKYDYTFETFLLCTLTKIRWMLRKTDWDLYRMKLWRCIILGIPSKCNRGAAITVFVHGNNHLK